MSNKFSSCFPVAVRTMRRLLLAVASSVMLLLAALLIYIMGESVFPATILVSNEAGINLRDVSVLGQAGVLAAADMGAGQSRKGNFRLAGVSTMEVRFTTPEGKTISREFLVAGMGWAREIEVVIDPSLKITRKEK